MWWKADWRHLGCFESHVQMNRQPQSCCKDGLVKAGHSTAIGTVLPRPFRKVMHEGLKLCRIAIHVWSHCPQVMESKYFGDLVTSEGKMEHKSDRQIGAASAVMWMLYHTAMGKREQSLKAKVYLLIYKLWLMCRKDWGHWYRRQKIVSFAGWMGSARKGKELRHSVRTHWIELLYWKE